MVQTERNKVKMVIIIKRKMLQVKKVLVSADGSKQSIRAIKLASQIAKGLNAEIMIIHVVELREFPTLMAEAENGLEEEKGQMILGEAVRIANFEGVEAKVVLKKGHIVDQILRFASVYKPDLIVLGSTGTSKIRGLLLGNVAHAISQYAKCTVMIAR